MARPFEETPGAGPNVPAGSDNPTSRPGAHDVPPEVARGKGIRHTRTGATWTGLVIGTLVLVLLLVFILQNLDGVVLELFAWEFTVPLGVTLLFAAIAGAVIVALVGSIRILQIRRAATRQRKLIS
ncbi:lipopolysaccharide assembly protein LapA domain-containing protein [Rhodococcus opacus]|uniref:Hypothetical membrane protein n=1 Tax=Rhodococcus opacus (strain B4) TaxID=632772 RepID=C1B8C2_RHOOB|nr:lipopolysaccharide assembly protein LapA domain-containing protein [Rhodococcus opacus]BAH51925.1 hypothetical membrane protein [Rhodococcus opacus B4]